MQLPRVMAALEVPALFTSIVLVDPVITETSINRSHVLYNFLVNTMLRRQSWPSREEARKALANSPFFAAWNPEVLDVYVQYCLTPQKDGNGVRLKLSPIQVSFQFTSPVSKSNLLYFTRKHLSSTMDITHGNVMSVSHPSIRASSFSG